MNEQINNLNKCLLLLKLISSIIKDDNRPPVDRVQYMYMIMNTKQHENLNV